MQIVKTQPSQFKIRLSTLMCVCVLCTNTFVVTAQKVGIVLSGGGAKGLVHIGVIKALEEHEIPIDYVAGTSMGAIVGSMYAIGATTDEIIAIVKSEEFRYWQTGEIQEENRYYFKEPQKRPEIFTLNFDIKKGETTSIQSNILPTNLMSPRQMNYALVPLYAPATAACGSDFDKLMVPFRCVASDIYKKKGVVFKSGNLGDAVRASMAFPFMFRPVVIDGELYFDGGIYNNYPVNVMAEDLKADYIIGSDVSGKDLKPEANKVLQQLESMIINRTEYPIKKGVNIAFELTNVSLWNFTIVDELVQLGYDSTIAHIDEIKAAVKRRTTIDQMQVKRERFKYKTPELKFQDVVFGNVDKQYQDYVRRSFQKKEEHFSFETFKEGYYQLLADDMFSEIIPYAIYDPQTGLFDLKLDVVTEKQLKVYIGGNISSSTPNQAYLGFRYQYLKTIAQSIWSDIYFGKTYNGLSIGTRVDFASNMYLKPQICLHRFDFYEGERVFYQDDQTSFFNQSEMYVKLSAGIPITFKSRLEAGIGYGYLTDSYIQDMQIAQEYQEYDKSYYSMLNVFCTAEANSLNNKSFATIGRAWFGSAQMLYGTQRYRSVLTPRANQSNVEGIWFQFKGRYEEYFKLAPYFTLGASGELAISTRQLQNNYTASVIQAPQFTPTPHSRIIFNEAYCANQYIACGIKPIYTITDRLQLRTEVYAFLPYKTISRQEGNTAAYSTQILSSPRFLAETSAVFDLKIATASLYVNYYSHPRSDWNAGLNVGFLLFKDKFID